VIGLDSFKSWYYYTYMNLQPINLIHIYFVTFSKSFLTIRPINGLRYTTDSVSESNFVIRFVISKRLPQGESSLSYAYIVELAELGRLQLFKQT